MRVAIDTNIIFCIWKGEAAHESVFARLVDFRRRGAKLLVCEVVWAELSHEHPSQTDFHEDLEDLGIEFDPLTPASAYKAGQIFASYKKAGGSKLRVLPDFLVGAHALNQADGLLTTDEGFVRAHFVGLNLF